MSSRVLVSLGPDRGITLSQLKKQKIRVIGEYPGFALVEASRKQLQQLRDRKITIISLGKRIIKVGGVRVEQTKLNDIPEELRAKPKAANKAGYYIVALIGPVQGEWRKKITSARANIIMALSGPGFVIKGTPSVVESVKKLNFIAWIEPYHPGLKLAANLFRCPARKLNLAQIRSEAITAKALPFGEVDVTFFKGEDPSAAVETVKKFGGFITATSKTQLRVRIAPKDVVSLATIEGVRRIDSYHPIQKDNDISAGILHVPDVQASHELDGEDQIIAVMDTGLDSGVDDATMHQDFQGRIEALVPLGSRVDAIDTDGHGTHVSGTALGDGSESGGLYAGMAPAARIVMLSWDYSGSSSDIEDWFDEAESRDARIQNNSWSAGSSSSYNSWPEAVDQYVWDHRDFLPVFSSGNSGRDTEPDGVADEDSLNPLAAAKNCLAVGGSENDRPSGSSPTPGRDLTYGDAYTSETLIPPIETDHFSDDPDGMFYHSSRGPTDDGRIKPDVIAPATNVLSTRSSFGPDPIPANVTGEEPELPDDDPLNPYYFWDTGTSMAAPASAGCAALARQYLIQQRGHERDDDHPRPSAALLKALLINGATDITGQYTPSEADDIPNHNEGWGLVNIDNSLFPETTGRIQFSDTPEYAVETGEIREFNVHVHDNSQPLKVTLVWTDAAGSGIINELYLRVEAPSGTMYDGDYDEDGVLNPYASVGVNGVQNNVQQVTIDTPELGQHTIQVIAVNVSEGMDPSPRTDLAPDTPVQDFALVVCNGTGYSKQPISLMQVIDRSGSMGYYEYMEPAKLRAQEMVDILQINDETGVVSFNETASLDHDLIPISSYDDKDDIKGAIEPLSSGGTTSIGAGVELAQDQFVDDGLPHAIVLLSDGYSNTAPYAIDPPDGSDPVVDEEFIDSGTVIYTIALGATADTDRLETIATTTSGQFYQINGYSDLHNLHEIYYNIQSLATGEEIIELDSDEAAPGETKTHPVVIDCSEAFFAVSSDDAEDSLELILVDPYGNDYNPDNPKAIYREGDGYRFYRVPQPIAGLWNVHVTNHHDTGDEEAGSTQYTLAVLSDSTINMDVNITGQPIVGKDLSFKVELTNNGEPIKSATVYAQIVRLSDPIKTLLKKYDKHLKEIKLDKKAMANDNQALARLARLDQLLTKKGKGSIFTTKTEDIKLSRSKQEGVYSATIPQSDSPEAYTVRVTAQGIIGTDPQTAFTRKAMMGVNITSAPRPQLDFKIKDIFLIPQIVKKPGATRFQPLLKKKNVIGIVVRDADGTPSTPKEGITLNVEIVLSDGKKQTIKDVYYSKHVGAYFITVSGVKGKIKVTAKATRGNVTRTRTERFLIK